MGAVASCRNWKSFSPVSPVAGDRYCWTRKGGRDGGTAWPGTPVRRSSKLGRLCAGKGPGKRPGAAKSNRSSSAVRFKMPPDFLLLYAKKIITLFGGKFDY